MPVSNERLVSEAAAFRREASREFDKAVQALLDLVWSRRAATSDFRFTDDPELDAEANAILRGLSDTLVARAKARAEAIIRDSLPEYDFGEEWEEDWDAADDEYDTPILWRFDMEGSHLRDLLEIWIALAVTNAISKSELRVLISRYLSNPFASPLWAGVPKGALAWGRGYSKNILEQIAIIGQNAIVGASRRAEQREERRGGATYYIRRRGSNYDCDVCEDMANIPIPIEEPFDLPHSRCMCYPEYHYGPIPNV